MERCSGASAPASLAHCRSLGIAGEARSSYLSVGISQSIVIGERTVNTHISATTSNRDIDSEAPRPVAVLSRRALRMAE